LKSTIHIIKIFCLLFLSTVQTNLAQDLSGFISTEARIFVHEPLDERQKGSGLSLAIKPELYYSWAGGDQSILLVPFVRIDQHDDQRTHWDIRELFWLYYNYDWELKIGFRQLFWGVTESQHLVDIINQTDFVENLDGEQKLGQPMVDFAWFQDWGTLNFLILTGFRERTFPGESGRFRFPLLINTDKAQYESDAGQKHIDLAARWSHTLGDFDFALSHFWGTSREPRFILNENNSIEEELLPFYDIINQTGLDVQLTTGGWLWKLETILRQSSLGRFYAFTGGFEYTFNNVDNSGIDVGVLTEYLYDNRDSINFPAAPFKNHIFVGSRLAFNDVQSTAMLAGAIISNETGSLFIIFEAERRIGESFVLNVESTIATNINPNELFYGFRKDSNILIELNWFY